MTKYNKEVRELEEQTRKLRAYELDAAEFESFWRTFDPNHHYDEEKKAFVRHLWEIVRQLNANYYN